MRIVHVSDCYLPRLGGIEVQVSELARRQVTAGHEVRVVTSVPGADPATDGSGGLSVWRPVGTGRRGGIRYRACLPGVAAALAGNPDVVHVHASTFSPLAFLTARAASRAGIPTVVTVHSLWAYATPLFRLADRLAGWSRWPVTWTAVSEAAAEPLRRILGEGTEVAVLPNAVDPADWQVPPAGRDPRCVHLVAVMRLAPRKRPRHLVRILHAVRDRVPADIRLTAEIVGDGPERRLLDRQLRRHDMTGWVRLTGRYDKPQVRDVLARADVFVSPALLESFGIAALEARCAGVPVVGRAGTGVSEFVTHGVDGLLARSDADMVEALVQLVTSPSERRRIATHNRSTAPAATWPHVLGRCELLYQLASDVPTATAAAAAQPAAA